jgi:hypothetical protein
MRCSAATRLSVSRSLRCPTRASGASSGSGDIQPGQKVKVKAAVTVFHVPKTKGAATPLQGLPGVVTAIVDKHTDGAQLSCTMPLKVRRTPAWVWAVGSGTAADTISM